MHRRRFVMSSHNDGKERVRERTDKQVTSYTVCTRFRREYPLGAPATHWDLKHGQTDRDRGSERDVWGLMS